VSGALRSQGGESRGVGATLGREVAAEAEHVRPGAKAQVFERRHPAQTQAFGDEAASMISDWQICKPVGRGDPAIQGAGAFGGLGGVLGDVGSDPRVREIPSRGDGSDVVFTAEVHSARRQSGHGLEVKMDGARGVGDGHGEYVERCPGRRRGCRPGGTIEPDDGVEVDHAATLVLGDLGVRNAELLGQPRPGDPGLVGERSLEGDGEAPQFGSAGVEQDRPDVVVAVGAQGLAEQRIVLSVAFSA
jgi:hypothetical protein